MTYLLISRHPKNQENFSGTDITVEINTATDGNIDRVEVFVDDALKTTLTDRPYKTTIVLSPGKHKLYARAYRSDGKTGTTPDKFIGVGGVSWDATPTPGPTSTPVPTP